MNTTTINVSLMGKRRKLTSEELAAAARLENIWDQKKKDLGLTQESVGATMDGKTQGAIGHFIKGRAPLNLDVTLKFAAILKCSPYDIYPEIIPDYLRHFILKGFTYPKEYDQLEITLDKLPVSKRKRLAELVNLLIAESNHD